MQWLCVPFKQAVIGGEFGGELGEHAHLFPSICPPAEVRMRLMERVSSERFMPVDSHWTGREGEGLKGAREGKEGHRRIQSPLYRAAVCHMVRD